jgi:cell division septation protein DedD
MFESIQQSPVRRFVAMTAVFAAACASMFAGAVPASADSLDSARAKLSEIRANRAARDAGQTVAAPAPAATVAEAPVPTEAKGAASPAPAAPAKKVDPRESTGPGRPELKLSGSFAYTGNPFARQALRVVIEEHAYQVGDRVKGARITKITDKDVTFTKDGDTWTLPAFTN